jgi:hypothetical protein
MIVIALTTNVATDAELTALTGMANQSFAYHSVYGCAYMFRNNIATGDLQADNLSGWWIKDSIIKCLNLAEYKAFRTAEIDTRTAELITLGYVYQGITFPLSQNGQINLLGMITTKDYLPYPISLNNIDDTAIYSITDATDLSNLYMTALGTKKAILDSGTALKTQINNAVDELEVSLIIDNR